MSWQEDNFSGQNRQSPGEAQAHDKYSEQGSHTGSSGWEVVGKVPPVSPFDEAWSSVTEQVDLQQLARELLTVIQAWPSEATPKGSADFIATVEAMRAAEKGDGPGALSHLAQAGDWPLEVAQSIGAAVATAAIRAAVRNQ